MAHRRLRIYLGERDKDAQGHVLHEAIVHEAHRRGLAGATVLRGLAGFGARARVHTARILRLSEDLPVVVEIVDTEEAIDGFVAWVQQVTAGQGMMTLEEVRIVR